MLQQDIIKKSSVALRVRIISSLIVVLLLVGLVVVAANQLSQWAPVSARIIKTAVTAFLFILWAIVSIQQMLRWQSKQYLIDDNSIRITKSTGLLSSGTVVYRFESIISVRVSQGWLAKRYGYGTVHFTIPKLDKEEAIADVSSPDGLIARIQSRLAEKGAATQTLIT
jgi:membrane protein YdbS with pleckstrin-like domain